MDEAVAVGISAFLEGDVMPSDDAVTESLRAAGVEPWLAERLLMFLPLAFGRRVLPEPITVSGQLSDGLASTELADDPVFVAASSRALLASRAELDRIGLRSSEVDAVNQALHAGSRPEDLELGPPTLEQPLPPPGTGDGGVPSPRAAFAAFLAGHGFAVEARPASASSGGARIGEFEFDARVFPFPRANPSWVMAQVDFAVRHPALAAPWLLESFAGVGTTWREALNQTVAKFERASLHPVIAALLDRSAGADQVSWERYEHPGGAFELCLGPQITLYSPEPAPPAGPALEGLLHALRDVPLSRAVHGLRVFTLHQDGELQTNEVLLDSETWTAGEEVIAATPPPPVPGMVGSRIFGLLVPAS